MENTKYSNATLASYGTWLENYSTSNLSDAWIIYNSGRRVSNDTASYSNIYGVRPAIEVSKSDIALQN